jgi:DnaK suppressor protein
MQLFAKDACLKLTGRESSARQSILHREFPRGSPYRRLSASIEALAPSLMPADLRVADQDRRSIMQEAQRIKATAVRATTVKRRAAKVTGGETTESRLLAMPESDYMNAEQLGFFRRRLEDLRRDLAMRRGDDSQDWSAEFEPDPADRASGEEQRFLAERLNDRDMAQLKEVNAALERIREERYGYCLRTGEAIGLRRLLARPTAALGVDAENREESRKRQFA